MQKVRGYCFAVLPFCFAVSLAFDPPSYNSSVVNAFFAKVLLNPPPPYLWDVYGNGSVGDINGTSVCGVQYEDEAERLRYSLATFSSAAAASAAGGHITHLHPCGACSSLHDLAVYLNVSDMTDPVRRCGLLHPLRSAGVQCLLEEVGFSLPCAEIWYDNTRNTRRHCLLVCLEWLGKPLNMPDGSLNPCLQCDEDSSGPLFKTYAGRTRRDSGLKSAIYRPPDTIAPITHFYY